MAQVSSLHPTLYAPILTSDEGTWSLPGGHLEYGETFEQCAKRETMEEIGMEIEDVEFVTATESMFVAETKQYVTIFMSAYAKSGEDGEVPEPQVSNIDP